MNADDVMELAGKNLTTKEGFKLWRMLTTRLELCPPGTLEDMRMREPELFGPALPDAEGHMHFPWQKGYKELRQRHGKPSTPDRRPKKNG